MSAVTAVGWGSALMRCGAVVWGCVGLLFYVMSILSPCIDELRLASHPPTPPSSPPSLPLIGLALFLAASWWQHTSHRTLASLRSPSSTPPHRSVYGVPTSGSFRVLVCPHYSAEMLIYLALCCIRWSALQGLVLGWVGVNLTITARKTRQWYAQRWPHQQQRRWCIIPWVY